MNKKTQKYLMFGALGLGAYMLMGRGGLTPATTTGQPPPAPGTTRPPIPWPTRTGGTTRIVTNAAGLRCRTTQWPDGNEFNVCVDGTWAYINPDGSVARSGLGPPVSFT
jgi:hypothetical protein